MTWKGCRGRWRPGAPAFRLPKTPPEVPTLRLPGPPSPLLPPSGSPGCPARCSCLPAPRATQPGAPAFRLPGPPSPVPPPSGSPGRPARLSRQLTPSIPLPQLLPVRRVHDSHLPARLVHYLHLHQRELVVRRGRFPALHQTQPFPHLRQHGVLAAFRR